MPSRFSVESTLALRAVVALLVVGSLLLSISWPSRADTGESVDAVIARLRVQEAPQPVRDRKQWRVPRKVVLLELGNPGGWAGRQEAFAAAAPKSQVVVVKDMAAAMTATVDADVIVGFNPEICSAKIIDNAKQLRWLSSLAAGVELCMPVPAVRGRDLLVTNMRGVDSAAIGEHAIALTLALAHGLDTFAVDTSQGIWSREHGGRTPM